MTTYAQGTIIDAGISGTVLTSNGGLTPPSFQTAVSTVLYPGLQINGYSGVGAVSPGVLLSPSTGAAYFTAYKAASCYILNFSIQSKNSTATTVTLQPYGSLTGGSAGLLGTPISVSVSANTYAAYTQAQSLSLSATGYLGINIISTNTASSLYINAQLWMTQATI